MKSPKREEDMEFIHGDINTCCLYFCESCNTVYRWCGEYESLFQVCPCPTQPKSRYQN